MDAPGHDAMLDTLSHALDDDLQEDGTFTRGQLEQQDGRWWYWRAELMDPQSIRPALEHLATAFYGDAHVRVEPGQITAGMIHIDLASDWPTSELTVANFIQGEGPRLGFSFEPPARWQNVSLPPIEEARAAFDEAIICVAKQTDGWAKGHGLRTGSVFMEGSRLVVKGELSFVEPCSEHLLVFDAPTMALRDVESSPCT